MVTGRTSVRGRIETISTIGGFLRSWRSGSVKLRTADRSRGYSLGAQSTPIMTTAVAPRSTKAVPPAKFSQNIELSMIAPDIPERERFVF